MSTSVSTVFAAVTCRRDRRSTRSGRRRRRRARRRGRSTPPPPSRAALGHRRGHGRASRHRRRGGAPSAIGPSMPVSTSAPLAPAVLAGSPSPWSSPPSTGLRRLPARRRPRPSASTSATWSSVTCTDRHRPHARSTCTRTVAGHDRLTWAEATHGSSSTRAATAPRVDADQRLVGRHRRGLEHRLGARAPSTPVTATWSTSSSGVRVAADRQQRPAATTASTSVRR